MKTVELVFLITGNFAEEVARRIGAIPDDLALGTAGLVEVHVEDAGRWTDDLASWASRTVFAKQMLVAGICRSA